MSPLRAAWRDYREAVAAFSHPARMFLLSTLLAWAGFGVNQVLFNLYLVEAGFQAGFVGRAIALNGLGLALAALPAGWIAERRSRWLCLTAGVVVDGFSLLVRACVLDPGVILVASFLAGAGQSLTAIAAAPFLTEHSTARERTHLFSAFFAAEFVAGVLGNLIGGGAPGALQAMPEGLRPDLIGAYRVTLIVGSLVQFAAVLPLARLRRLPEAPLLHDRAAADPAEARKLWPIAVNAFLIGAGAGLVIPFMNLYFKTRFDCSSAQIGVFFSVAQVGTALGMLLGPLAAHRLGKLRAATALQLLSLPFLVTLGAERHLAVAVGAFWVRATLMQSSMPLLGAFVMETLPARLRARAASFTNLVWNLGWAASATFSGALIQRLGYAVPFYVTAALYAAATLWFYRSFRGVPEARREPQLSEEAKGLRGGGPMTE